MEPMSAPDLRDQGLRRVSRLTGWLAAAGVLAVGAFAGLLARPQPSTTKVTATGTDGVATDQGASTSSGSTRSSGGSTSSTVRSGSTKRSTPPVTRPSQPPVQSRQRGPAVSGGS